MNPLKIVLFVICALNFASFFWSVFGVFTKTEKQDRIAYGALGLGSFATWSACLHGVWMSDLSVAQVLLALVIQIVSAGLFWWARSATKAKRLTIVFSEDTPKFLVNEGPYKWVRHPFYTSYMINYVGLALLTRMPFVIGAASFMTVVYLVAARREEKKFSHSPFQKDYQTYAARTGAFFPNPLRRKAS